VLAYAVRRVLAVFPVMAVVVVFVFVLLRLAPGDPAAIIAGDYATPDAIAKIRTALGLDQPIYVQLGVYVSSLARGDLGRSLHSRLPVRTPIAQRLEPTLALATSTLVFAVGLAIPLGVLAAWRAGTWVDRAVMIFAVGGFSIPVFWLGFLMIYGFSIRLDLFPVQGYAPLAAGLGPFTRHLFLPTLTLGLIYKALRDERRQRAESWVHHEQRSDRRADDPVQEMEKRARETRVARSA
jgi:peptide/nickel transport system permease protein